MQEKLASPVYFKVANFSETSIWKVSPYRLGGDA